MNDTTKTLIHIDVDAALSWGRKALEPEFRAARLADPTLGYPGYAGALNATVATLVAALEAVLKRVDAC